MKNIKTNFASSKLFGYILAAFSIFFWGITFVSTKYLLSDFSSSEILFYRVIAAFSCLWILHPKREKILMKDNLLFALAALTGVVFYQLMENVAIHFTNASNVSVIVSICPLFTAIISQIFLKEKHLTFWFLLGFVIAITGVTLVCLNGNKALEFNPKGDILALLAGICWGFYSMIISILNRRKYNQICLARRIFFFAVLFMTLIAVAGYFLKHNGIGAADSSTGSAAIQSFYFDLSKEINAVRFSNPFNWIKVIPTMSTEVQNATGYDHAGEFES